MARRKFGGDIMKTLAVRIVGCWNKVSVQVIKSLIISFQEYDFKISWLFLGEKMNSQVSWDLCQPFTLHVFLPVLTLVFVTELALQRYSENVSSDNHAVIFREQQRQVCSLREGLLEARMTTGCTLTDEEQPHGVWPECAEPGAGNRVPQQTQARQREKSGLESTQGTWTVRSSRRQDWKQGYYTLPRSIQQAGPESGLNTSTPLVSLGSA